MELSAERIRAVRARIQAKTRAQPRLERVERIAAPPIDEFFARYAEPSIPVVLAGAADAWPARAWTFQTLRDRFGALELSVRARHYPGRDPALVGAASSTLAAYVDAIERERFSPDEPKPYAANQSLPDAWRDAVPPPPYFKADAYLTRVWIGPGGTVSRAHCDYADNFLAQLIGDKHITLFAPDEAELLDAEEGAPSFMSEHRSAPRMLVAAVDPDAPDLASHPRYAGAHRVECRIGPGDVLFLPSCWFHHVRSLTASLSVNFFAAHEDLPAAAR